MMRPEADPLPGDFDQDLVKLEPVDAQVVDAARDRSLVVQVALDVDDAAALQQIARDQGERPSEVVRSLIREASRRAA
jgi:hypothetical protein